MTDTETQKGLTNKHILIFLPNGALLQLPKVFLDPRRPIKPTPESQEEGVMPYVPELPVPSEMMITYNQTIFKIKHILTAPTSLESTSLVLAYGLGLFSYFVWIKSMTNYLFSRFVLHKSDTLEDI